MALLQLQQVTKQLGRAAVLNDISFIATPGIHLLVGANGAGKSTLLRTIAGIVSPDSGMVHFEERTPPREMFGAIGYLGHKTQLYPHLSVEENLRLFSAVVGQALRSETLTTWGLQGRNQQQVSELSKGLTVRLSLARIFSTDYQYILLDEPTNALDEQGCALLLEELRAVAAKGSVILIASHDLARLSACASRVLVLAEGRIVDDSEHSGIEGALAQYRRVNR